VGFKLGWEYLEQAGVVHLAIPQWLSLGIIGVIFTAAFVYAKLQGPAEITESTGVDEMMDEEAAALEPSDHHVHK
jgi:hypothetical protein